MPVPDDETKLGLLRMDCHASVRIPFRALTRLHLKMLETDINVEYENNVPSANSNVDRSRQLGGCVLRHTGSRHACNEWQASIIKRTVRSGEIRRAVFDGLEKGSSDGDSEFQLVGCD